MYNSFINPPGRRLWHASASPVVRRSEETREQFRRWKETRFGFFEVGRVRGDTVTLQEWDVVGHVPVGDSFLAITLGMGGVDFFRSDREYIAYRERFGPPPGVRDAPDVIRLK